jgi:hypothetical protein
MKYRCVQLDVMQLCKSLPTIEPLTMLASIQRIITQGAAAGRATGEHSKCGTPAEEEV